jgi:hypothetical protein
MRTEHRYLALAIAAVVGMIVLLFSIRISPARDLGQWDTSDPAVTEWYRSLMQPTGRTNRAIGRIARSVRNTRSRRTS